MKKHTEKPPIDDLFARKLGNMSLPPSADGSERLQARMNQQKPEIRLVFWRNPTVRPYMAAAACLALVSLFGWLYWPSASSNGSVQSDIAVNKKKPEQLKRNDQQPSGNQQQIKEIDEAPAGLESITSTEQVASNDKAIKEESEGSVLKALKGTKAVAIKPAETRHEQDEPAIAQTKTIENKANGISNATTGLASVEALNTDRVAENKASTKPVSTAERVLEVTIAEPQALVVARQEAKAIIEEKAVVAQNEKVEKETKGSLWQQVKRIKQGEVFARQDDMSNEDRGLLGRAYSGLKHSLDKEKAAKQ